MFKRSFAEMLHKKRIIIVLGSLELGGSEWQAIQLSLFLKKHYEADVEIWGFNTTGRAGDLCSAHKIPWRTIPFHLGKNPVLKLRDIIHFVWRLRREHPDVVLSYTLLPNVVCGLAWRLSRVKLSIWNQRDEGLGLSRFRILHRFAAHMTKYFISNSHHAKDFLVCNFGINSDQISVIHNGIALPDNMSRVVSRNSLNISDDCFAACMVANLHVYKDHVTLLKAWRKVVDFLLMSKRSCILLLAGRFDETYPALKTLVSKLDLLRHVAFLGKVNNVHELLAAADLYVHSSHHEGLPNGVLEGMAAGLPVAATDIPGIREVVGLDAYKYLAKPHDEHGLSDIIITFAENPELAARVGATNRLRVQTDFSLDTMCSHTLSVIQQRIENS